MQETIIVNQEIGFKEFLKASFCLLPRMKSIQKVFKFLLAIGLFIALLGLFSQPLSNTKWYLLILDILIPSLSLLIFLIVFMPIGLFAQMKLKPNNFKDITYRFTNSGMEKIGKGINISNPWNKFLRSEETKNFILLFISDNDAHIIQKRMFEDDEKMENFKTMIFNYIGG
jgi:hypothetical protein